MTEQREQRDPRDQRGPRDSRGGRDNRGGDGGDSDVVDRLVSLNRCAKVVKGGRRFSFSALVVAGDGNGRVGRLLSAYILKKGGYDFSGLVPFEQYLDEHRDDYYYFLGRDRQDVTEFVEFYLTALLAQAGNASLHPCMPAGRSCNS